MAQWLKQSTAYTFQLGPFVDNVDGYTPEASLTIAATDVDLSKNGGAYADKNDATALTGTGDSQGWYDCVLDTTDTNTLGKLDVRCYVSGALPVFKSFMVVPAGVYDAQVGTASAVIFGTVDTGGGFTPTTTQFECDDITEATADHYNGRSGVFLTGALAGQGFIVSDYSLQGSNGRFTVTRDPDIPLALTEAPSNNDTIIIV